MPIVDRSKVAKAESGGGQGEKIAVPGKYLVQVKHATSKVREDGAEEWMLLTEITTGPHKGKVWFENLYWTERATDRCLNILSALGVEVPETGAVEYKPEMAVGKKAFVELIPSGKEQYPVKSKYDGWTADYPF